MSLEAPRATRGKKVSIIGGYIEIDKDRSRAIDKADYVLSGDSGVLSDFAKPPGTIEGMVPYRGSDG